MRQELPRLSQSAARAGLEEVRLEVVQQLVQQRARASGGAEEGQLCDVVQDLRPRDEALEDLPARARLRRQASMDIRVSSECTDQNVAERMKSTYLRLSFLCTKVLFCFYRFLPVH